MSQLNVERVIGVLATDEAWRQRFVSDPTATLRHLGERGFELTPGELRALATMDLDELVRFAEKLDARLQKIDSGGSWL